MAQINIGDRYRVDYSSLGLLHRSRDILLLMFFTDIVFGGSLGFIISGVSLRKLLTLALIGIFLASLLMNPLLKRWQLLLLVSLTSVTLVWGVFIPTLRGIDLNYSIAESSPLLGLLLVFPLVQAFNQRGVSRYLDFINLCMAIVSFIIIVVWILANYLDLPEYALGLKLFYMIVSGDDFGTYIGPMPDGSFRVMWITCLLLPFLLMYKNIHSFSLGWSVFYILTIYATGTRSFLYAALFVLSILLFRHRRILFALLAPVAIIVILVGSQRLEGIRLFEVASEFDSDSARFEQFFSLLRLFSDYPFLGAGFGAHADVLRSDVAPYSYELTYVALLAKLGSLGFISLVILLFFLVSIALHRFRGKSLEILAITFSFLFVTSTNPYLINFVGITIVSVLIAIVFYQDNLRKKIRPVPLMSAKATA
ncbi:MAG: O-antigen ligase family protein [Gammaproteobacteria bacterium]|nr:O-antigen ligase family protein [Gammaproteobacteria bacterium]